jgi:cytochrome c peroxidase
MSVFTWAGRAFAAAAVGGLAACGLGACAGSDGGDTSGQGATAPIVSAPPTVARPNASQAATVGVAFTYDASQANATFTDPRGKGLTYSVALAPSNDGLAVSGGRITGTPAAPMVLTATVTASDGQGGSATNTFSIVVFSAGLRSPMLHASLFAYSDASSPLPPHFMNAPGPGGAVLGTDNTLASNSTTNTGATLGRVLFYDTRLSRNDAVSCASCHQQSLAFGDGAKLSRGFAGGLTKRHASAIANARFYQRGRFFWDERAATLEDQVLMPIQDTTEMGLTLPALVAKVSATPYYAPLFEAAFGTTDVTSERISRALAQFVRSMVSAQSKFDQAFAGQGPPNFAGVLSQDEELGRQLFVGQARCAQCHVTNAQVSDNIHNTGLDAVVVDTGAGGGRFKAPSLRNIAVRAPYMHDGRFTTLDEVIAHYDGGVRANPNLDPRLRGPNGVPQRLNLTRDERAALVAYLRTLTDPTFLTAPKFSDPFAVRAP